ncbi:MAG: hypothetical protein PWQ79_1857 [Thermococcaceae archaeon]|nr:hypothetical protein [Thermococcaceae archaeon]
MSKKSLVVILAIPALLAIFGSSYVLRWISVLLLGIILGLFLFGVELEVSPQFFKRGQKKVRASDFERMKLLIAKAKKGEVARKLVEEKIIEIYATLSENYSGEYRKLKSEPNEALRLLRSGGDFLENLEKAIKAVEADLDEVGRC